MTARPKIVVMTYCRDGDRFLMLRRNKEPFTGYWVAPGGKVEHGEAPWQTAIREMREETGLRLSPADLRLRGVITETSARPDWQWLIFAFVAERFDGTVDPDCPEGELAWWTAGEIAELDIPEADAVFTPHLLDLERSVYQGCFRYDDDLRLAEVLDPDAPA
jgi:8-oxo-dGTP diphosphatase